MDKDINELLNVKEEEQSTKSSSGDFWAFKRMITPAIIQILFWVGSIITMIFGIIQIVIGVTESYGGGGLVLVGLITTLIGPLIIRIYCELLILLFRMHETLIEIKNKIK